MEAFLGSIQAVGFNFAPRGFSFCEGQIISISENQALYALLGTTFGGDGRTSLGLPDLRGRSVVGVGVGPGLSPISWGERYGYEQVRLDVRHLPSHNHTATFQPDGSGGAVEVYVQASKKGGDTSAKSGSYLANVASGPSLQKAYASEVSSDDLVTLSGVYATGGGSGTGTVTVDDKGGSTPFPIRNPYLGMNQIISTEGIFPARN